MVAPWGGDVRDEWSGRYFITSASVMHSALYAWVLSLAGSSGNGVWAFLFALHTVFMSSFFMCHWSLWELSIAADSSPNEDRHVHTNCACNSRGFTYIHSRLRICLRALTGVAQLAGYHSSKRKVASSIPGQGTFLGVHERQCCFSHQCEPPSLPPHLLLSLKRKSLLRNIFYVILYVLFIIFIILYYICHYIYLWNIYIFREYAYIFEILRPSRVLFLDNDRITWISSDETYDLWCFVRQEPLLF